MADRVVAAAPMCIASSAVTLPVISPHRLTTNRQATV